MYAYMYIYIYTQHTHICVVYIYKAFVHSVHLISFSKLQFSKIGVCKNDPNNAFSIINLAPWGKPVPAHIRTPETTVWRLQNTLLSLSLSLTPRAKKWE